MPQCHGGCDSRGRVNLGRIYRYYGYLSNLDGVSSAKDSPGVLNTEQLRDRLSGNWAFLLQTTCLRPAGAQPTPGFRLYPGCPVVLNERRRFKNVMAEDHAAYSLLEQQLRAMRPQTAELDVDRIAITGKNGTVALAFVSGHNATYCPNIEGFHKSARAYFYITPSGLEQRCGCKCDTVQGRKSGMPCKDWKSIRRQVTPELCAALFPNVHMGHNRNMLQGIGSATPVSPTTLTPRRGSFIERATASTQPNSALQSGQITPLAELDVGSMTRSASLPQMDIMASITAKLTARVEAIAKQGEREKGPAPKKRHME